MIFWKTCPKRSAMCSWYLDSIEAIVHATGFTQSKVTSMLHRTRGKLRKRLSEEGYV